MGLANRLTDPGRALDEALALAHQLAAFPQVCLRSDRLSAYEQWAMDGDEALGTRPAEASPSSGRVRRSREPHVSPPARAARAVLRPSRSAAGQTAVEERVGAIAVPPVAIVEHVRLTGSTDARRLEHLDLGAAVAPRRCSSRAARVTISSDPDVAATRWRSCTRVRSARRDRAPGARRVRRWPPGGTAIAPTRS